jgi:hypothetical protein
MGIVLPAVQVEEGHRGDSERGHLSLAALNVCITLMTA